MEFENFIKTMGESWLSTTLARLGSYIQDDYGIGQVITVITVDFDLEKDLRQHIVDTGTRQIIYDGLTELLFNYLNKGNYFTELRSNNLLHAKKEVY